MDVLTRIGKRFKIKIRYILNRTPKGHGPALHWLLTHVQGPYCLYTQDDHETVRNIPAISALQTMARYHLNQIRFNKRATVEFKETHKGRWYKKEVRCEDKPLCVSDHWYFQTSLWRVSAIKPVVDAYQAHWHEGKWFNEHSESKINAALDGYRPDLYTPDPPIWGDPSDPNVREVCQRTFIWGPIGNDRYIKHIGDDPKDWAGTHPRDKDHLRVT